MAMENLNMLHETKMDPPTQIDSNYNYGILTDESVFIPHVYESIWIKLRIKNGQDKIIGNIYRPNTAPRASLEQALQIHEEILGKINANKNHEKL